MKLYNGLLVFLTLEWSLSKVGPDLLCEPRRIDTTGMWGLEFSKSLFHRRETFLASEMYWPNYQEFHLNIGCPINSRHRMTMFHPLPPQQQSLPLFRRGVVQPRCEQGKCLHVLLQITTLR